MHRTTPAPARPLSLAHTTAHTIALLSLAAAPGLASVDWLQAGADAANTFANTAETTITPQNTAQLHVLWSTSRDGAQGAPWGVATESDGQRVECVQTSTVQGRSAATGALTWTRADLIGNCWSAAQSGGTAFVPFTGVTGPSPSNNGMVALDVAPGTTRWQASWPAASSLITLAPAVVGDTVFVTDREYGFRALDKLTGATLWQARPGTGVTNNSVVVANGQLFLSIWGSATAAPALYAFDAATGQPQWSRNLTDCSYYMASPIVLGDLVFTVHCSTLTAHRAPDGSVAWNRSLTDMPIVPLAGHDGTLFMANFSNIVALDARTGQQRWRRSLDQSEERVGGNLVWANGMLFLQVEAEIDKKLMLRVLDANTGKRLSNRLVQQGKEYIPSYLTVSDGRVNVDFSRYNSHTNKHKYYGYSFSVQP